MKAQLFSATLFTAFSGVLSAADSQLLNLVMPDAKVIAGVNVEQAKGTQFGQWVLNQIQTNDADMQKLITLTGFDPRRDVREVLVASDGTPQSKSGLALARGNFDTAKITTAATTEGKDVVTETYAGVTILEDTKGTHGIAFLDRTTVAAGDLASVKGAIDRSTNTQPLNAALLVKINHWSTSQDAWGISTVPPSSFAPAPPATGNHPPNPMTSAAQNVQEAYGGVKFGNNVVFTGEAVCDTAQNANALADMVKFVVNLAQMQGGQDPKLQALANSVSVTPTGTSVKVMASLPQDVFTQMLQPHHKVGPAGLHTRKQ
jgi:hypothetical protein